MTSCQMPEVRAWMTQMSLDGVRDTQQRASDGVTALMNHIASTQPTPLEVLEVEPRHVLKFLRDVTDPATPEYLLRHIGHIRNASKDTLQRACGLSAPSPKGSGITGSLCHRSWERLGGSLQDNLLFRNLASIQLLVRGLTCQANAGVVRQSGNLTACRVGTFGWNRIIATAFPGVLASYRSLLTASGSEQATLLLAELPAEWDSFFASLCYVASRVSRDYCY